MIDVPDKQKLYMLNNDPACEVDCAKLYYIPIIRKFYLKRIQIISSLMPEGRQSVLDAGFGSGILFYELRKKFSGLYGVDVRKDVDKVREKLSEDGIKVSVERADICKMPYKDRTFDCVVSMSVLEHMKDLEKPLKEIKRVLKDDGFFVCGFPAKNFFTHYFLRLVGFDEEKNHPSSHRHIYDAIQKEFFIEKTVNSPSFFPLYISCRCRKIL